METGSLEKPIFRSDTPAAPQGPEVEEVPFKRLRLFHWRMLTISIAFSIGVFLGAQNAASDGHPSDPAALLLIAAVGAGFMLLMMVFQRASIRRKGGIPPLKFMKDQVEVPINVQSLKTRNFPYDKILSVSVYGKGKRARLIFDTQQRAFAYPLREFEDANAADRVRDILRRRISALPDGLQRWKEVEKRLTVAGIFANFRPVATWGIIATIVAAFIGQQIFMKDDVFGFLDLGANSPSLVMQGEWFRLVTANLLHANLLHIYCNAFFGYIVGAMVEREMGSRRFLLLTLATGILSALTSALWMQYTHSSHLFSVGISGALFGMLGGQVVITRKFGQQLPGGYRFTARTWWSLLGINFLLIPALVPEVDTACHAGGFISGIAIAWLLCEGQDDITQPPPVTAGAGMTLALLAALWAGAVAQAAGNLMNPDTLAADHLAVAKQVADDTNPSAEIDNDIAWSLAVEARPSRQSLDTALKLANRAVAATALYKGSSHRAYGISSDTLATVYYRKGDFEQAVTIEQPLLDDGGPDVDVFATQLARFLNAYTKEHHGPRIVGSAQDLPQLTLGKKESSGETLFNVTFPSPLQNGAEAIALLMQGDRILGLVDINAPRLTVQPQLALPADAFDDLDASSHEPARLVLVQFDSTQCRCNDKNSATIDFAPYNSAMNVP